MVLHWNKDKSAVVFILRLCLIMPGDDERTLVAHYALIHCSLMEGRRADKSLLPLEALIESANVRSRNSQLHPGMHRPLPAMLLLQSVKLVGDIRDSIRFEHDETRQKPSL